MLTIIAHMFNESYLLPWWLEHHVPRADHGIIFDYASTDGSPDIVRTLAPTWEVRKSRNADFNAAEVDREVMDAEREVDGWKIVLNVTEFLVGAPAAAMHGERAVLRSKIIVDPPMHADAEPDPAAPLVHQRAAGVYNMQMRQGRLLHRRPCGDYTIGRHIWEPPTTTMAEVWWYGYSPWTARGRARKLQIQTRIPECDRIARLGWHHHIDEMGLWQQYREMVGRLG